MKSKFKIETVISYLCLTILVIFMISILARFFSRQILIKNLGMDNSFTRLIWFDNAFAGGYSDNALEVIPTVYVNWEEQYPFKDAGSNTARTESFGSSVRTKVEKIEDDITSYCSDLLIFKNSFLETNSKIKKLFNWNFASYSEYNGIIKLDDGHLTTYIAESDMEEQAASIARLAEYCESSDTEFLYVVAPYKICKYDDSTISGVLDFSNQNTDSLIKALRETKTNYLDLRDVIHEQGLDHHELFYKTDHHWKTTTGLWAAQQIMKCCNERYGWDADLELLDADNFYSETYYSWFLGSRGKKATLGVVSPDDFIVLYPNYDVLFRYQIPSLNLDLQGDYSVCYRMDLITKCDYYNYSTYAGCNYGDNALTSIDNLLIEDGKKILIISDSFGDCVISCLALTVDKLDSIDVRQFSGSVETYIAETHPDIVIMMNNAGIEGGKIDWNSHESLWDVR